LLVHSCVALLSRNGLIRDDAESYVLLARHLSDGYGFVFEKGGHATSWRAPGYPLFLAAILHLSDNSLLAARCVQAVLWLVTCYCTYRLAARTVGEKDALLAAGGVGLFPSLVGLTGLVWSESLFICLFMATVLGMSYLREKKSVGYWVIMGLLLGASVLTRSTAVVLLPVTAYFAGPSRRKAAAIVAVASMLVIAPWCARNYLVHGRFILVESNAAFNLYVGNRPSTPIPLAWRSVDTVYSDPEYQRLTDGKTEGEAYRTLMDAAERHMLERPLRTALLFASKTLDFWMPDVFLAGNLRSGAFGVLYRPYWIGALAVSVLGWLVVMVAAVRHFLTRRKAWHVQFFLAILVLYTLPHSVIFGTTRHHLPLMPLLIIMAAPELRRLHAAVFRGAVRRQGTFISA
jgi:4-amino-4-deoxy-L-arabinose transferase-like glycosyltransferase